MKTTLLLIFTCMALALSTANGVRIKIHLEKNSIERYQRHVYKRQAMGPACSDFTEVDPSTLMFKERLNGFDDRVKFYKSPTATEMINNNFLDTLEVPFDRLQNPTLRVREVLNVLNGSECFPFLFGGSVRDQFILNSTLNDADLEINCTIDEFHQVCTSAWGSQNCDRSGNSAERGHIGVRKYGVDNVDVATTSSTFFAPIYKLEYAVNAMAYELFHDDVFIDLTGYGLQDVCDSGGPLLRIPSDSTSPDNSWEMWYNETIGPDSILRFWKFRARGYSAFNNETKAFVVNKAKEVLQDNDGINVFGKFYCKNVYSGSTYDTDTKRCKGSEQNCSGSHNTKKIPDYSRVLAADFEDYWTNTIEPNYVPTCVINSGSSTTPTSPAGGGAQEVRYHVSVVGVLLIAAVLLGSC